MSRQQRDLKTLIQQAMLMQDIDRRAKSNVMITGWLNDLTSEEKAEFQDWLTQTVGPMMDRVLSWYEDTGKNVIESLVDALTAPCPKCGQVDIGQSGECLCTECGLPVANPVDILPKNE